jgi:N-carbamoyl-L-amino-acid hydrolase
MALLRSARSISIYFRERTATCSKLATPGCAPRLDDGASRASPLERHQPPDRRRAPWDSLMRMAEIGATPRGGVRRLRLSAGGRAGPRALQGLVRSPRPSGPRGRHGQHVRPARRARPAPRAGALRQPPRQPALRRQVRRRARRAGRAGGDAEPARPRHRHRSPARTGQLDRRGRQQVRPLADGQRRLGGRLPGRRDPGRPRHRGVSVGEALDGIGARGPHPRRPSPPTPTSSSTSSKAPSSNGRKAIGVVTGAQAQVWWDARVRGRTATPAPPRPPPGATRWCARPRSWTWWTA